jgi:hypothetical protein
VQPSSMPSRAGTCTSDVTTVKLGARSYAHQALVVADKSEAVIDEDAGVPESGRSRLPPSASGSVDGALLPPLPAADGTAPGCSGVAQAVCATGRRTGAVGCRTTGPAHRLGCNRLGCNRLGSDRR